MKNHKKLIAAAIGIVIILSLFYSNVDVQDSNDGVKDTSQVVLQTENKEDNTAESTSDATAAVNAEESKEEETAEKKADSSAQETVVQQGNQSKSGDTYEYEGKTYKVIEVDGGDLSGNREPNVAVDVGFGDRVYWALTNEYCQLVYVIADKVVLQDDETEPVTSKGRYYADEAKVPGVERSDLDEGHVLADSLGGCSNAYNITPQNSTLNRSGDQAYMEKVIRDAGGCENFVATITYPNNDTQIPSKYKYEYTLLGERITDEFDNVDPDEVNSHLEEADNKEIENKAVESSKDSNEDEDISTIDTNGDGKITIAEAKAAGYKMPISSDQYIYKYMDDRDGDGLVGE